MTNLVQELNSLDFSVYIGGPLQAAVDAQHAASMSQVSFIKEVGFETRVIPTVFAADGTTVITASKTVSDLRYVDFKHYKRAPNPNFRNLSTTVPAGTNIIDEFIEREVTIKVPFLTMLTIPALRIEEVNIDFNAKLTSVETRNVSSEFGASVEASGKLWKVRFKASASYKRSTSSTTNIEKTYNLGVRVRAVNDELPAGLDRILTMLESSIVGA